MSVSKKDVTFNELPTNELSIWQLTLLCNCYFRVTALSSRVIGLILQRQLSNLTAGVRKNSAFNNWPLFSSWWMGSKSAIQRNSWVTQQGTCISL